MNSRTSKNSDYIGRISDSFIRTQQEQLRSVVTLSPLPHSFALFLFQSSVAACKICIPPASYAAGPWTWFWWSQQISDICRCKHRLKTELFHTARSVNSTTNDFIIIIIIIINHLQTQHQRYQWMQKMESSWSEESTVRGSSSWRWSNWPLLNTLCSEKKHPLTFSSISPRVMCRFKQKLQWIYLRNGRFWPCRN